MKEQQHHHHIYGQCKRYMHSYVLVELDNGDTVDGIITGLDEDNAYLAIPIRADEKVAHPSAEQRQFGSGYGHGHHGSGHGYGYGYPGSGYSHGYGYSGGPFRRLILPLTAIAALSLLPWY